MTPINNLEIRPIDRASNSQVTSRKRRKLDHEQRVEEVAKNHLHPLECAETLLLIIKHSEAPSVAARVSKFWHQISYDVYKDLLIEIKGAVGKKIFEEVEEVLFPKDHNFAYNQQYFTFFKWALDLHLLVTEVFKFPKSRNLKEVLKTKPNPILNSLKRELILKAFAFRKSLSTHPKVLTVEEIRLSTALKKLPPELAFFKNLEALEIDLDSPITDLEPVTALPNLQFFEFLSRTPLPTVPESFNKLIKLHFLNLCCSQLPKGLLAHLTQLSHLSLFDCPSPPLKEIAQLKLITLTLYRCSLTEFPTEILNLTRLEALDLSENPIKAVPAEIQRLSSLQELDLVDTNITTLPEEIVSIQNLKVNVRESPIETLSQNVLQSVWLETDCYGSLITLPEVAFRTLNLEVCLLVSYLFGHLISACEKEELPTISKIVSKLPTTVLTSLVLRVQMLYPDVITATSWQLKRVVECHLLHYMNLTGLNKDAEKMKACLEMIREVRSDAAAKAACDLALDFFEPIQEAGTHSQMHLARLVFATKGQATLTLLLS